MPKKASTKKSVKKENKVQIILAAGSKIITPEKKEKLKSIRLARPANGYIVGDKVIVEDEEYELALPLYSERQFGEKHGVKKHRLEFSLTEALYLMERDKVNIYSTERSKTPMSVTEFVRKAGRLEVNFWTRYRVYRDLRTRGYTVKTALKFGADFRVYQRGKKAGEVHAKWVLFCANENDSLTWRDFAAMNRVAHSTRKNLLIGIVDDEGDLTFYVCQWKKP